MEPTKSCVACCEPIAFKAKVCAHCHQRQDRVLQFLSSAFGGLLALFAVGGFFFYMAHRESHEFKDHAGSISVRSERVHAEAGSGAAYASCIGEVSNASPYGWRDIAVEARYFNLQNELIDTASERHERIHLPANGNVAIRVLDRAARSPSSYASCRLSIKNAASR